MKTNDKSEAITGWEYLHELSQPLNQLSFLGRRCEEVLHYLDVMMERSYAVAPIRTSENRPKSVYQFNCEGRSERPSAGQKERLLEYLLWEQWGTTYCGDQWFLPQVCRYLQSYQMPLWEHQGDKSGRYIDLIGVSWSWTPVVIELKKGDSKETPLRMIIEALGYGLCVRKAWNDRADDGKKTGIIDGEWWNEVGSHAPETLRPDLLVEVPLVCLAESEYWKKCFGEPLPKRTAGQVAVDSWEPLRRLISACTVRGFPVTFAEIIECTANQEDTSPSNEKKKTYTPRIVEIPTSANASTVILSK